MTLTLYIIMLAAANVCCPFYCIRILDERSNAFLTRIVCKPFTEFRKLSRLSLFQHDASVCTLQVPLCNLVLAQQ